MTKTPTESAPGPRTRLEEPRCPTCDAWASGVLEDRVVTVPLVQDGDVFWLDYALEDEEPMGARDDVQVQCPNGHSWRTTRTDEPDSADAELAPASVDTTPVLVGHVGVDSGSMYIGDPCYVIGAPLGGMDWEAFCTTYQLPSAMPQPVEDLGGGRSLGIVSPTGYGDGVYPVYAVIVDGRVMSLTISFGVPV